MSPIASARRPGVSFVARAGETTMSAQQEHGLDGGPDPARPDRHLVDEGELEDDDERERELDGPVGVAALEAPEGPSLGHPQARGRVGHGA